MEDGATTWGVAYGCLELATRLSECAEHRNIGPIPILMQLRELVVGMYAIRKRSVAYSLPMELVPTGLEFPQVCYMEIPHSQGFRFCSPLCL